MLEIKVTIEAPALAEAINRLAGSIGNSVPVVSTAQTVIPAAAQTQQANAGQAQTEFMNAPTEQTNEQQTQPTAAVQNVTATVQEAQTTVPTATAPAVDLEAISRAGAALIDQGKMPQVMALLQKYGVQAITQLQASTYPAFAEELRGLGAAI